MQNFVPANIRYTHYYYSDDSIEKKLTLYHLCVQIIVNFKMAKNAPA